MKTIGMILVIVGIVALIYSGFTYTTEKEVVDLGPIDINKEEKHRVSWPPVAGVVLLLGGALMLVIDRRQRV
jgi:hypothetical protein